MLEFFEKEGLIVKEQHGFLKRIECVTNLLETLDLITKSLFEGFVGSFVGGCNKRSFQGSVLDLLMFVLFILMTMIYYRWFNKAGPALHWGLIGWSLLEIFIFFSQRSPPYDFRWDFSLFLNKKRQIKKSFELFSLQRDMSDVS